jgi:hypothetical protein
MPDTLNKNAQPVLSFRLAISAQSQGARRFPERSDLPWRFFEIERCFENARGC